MTVSLAILVKQCQLWRGAQFVVSNRNKTGNHCNAAALASDFTRYNVQIMKYKHDMISNPQITAGR